MTLEQRANCTSEEKLTIYLKEKLNYYINMYKECETNHNGKGKETADYRIRQWGGIVREMKNLGIINDDEYFEIMND